MTLNESEEVVIESNNHGPPAANNGKIPLPAHTASPLPLLDKEEKTGCCRFKRKKRNSNQARANDLQHNEKGITDLLDDIARSESSTRTVIIDPTEPNKDNENNISKTESHHSPHLNSLPPPENLHSEPDQTPSPNAPRDSLAIKSLQLSARSNRITEDSIFVKRNLSASPPNHIAAPPSFSPEVVQQDIENFQKNNLYYSSSKTTTPLAQSMLLSHNPALLPPAAGVTAKEPRKRRTTFKEISLILKQALFDSETVRFALPSKRNQTVVIDETDLHDSPYSRRKNPPAPSTASALASLRRVRRSQTTPNAALALLHNKSPSKKSTSPTARSPAHSHFFALAERNNSNNAMHNQIFDEPDIFNNPSSNNTPNFIRHPTSTTNSQHYLPASPAATHAMGDNSVSLSVTLFTPMTPGAANNTGYTTDQFQQRHAVASFLKGGRSNNPGTALSTSSSFHSNLPHSPSLTMKRNTAIPQHQRMVSVQRVITTNSARMSPTARPLTRTSTGNLVTLMQSHNIANRPEDSMVYYYASGMRSSAVPRRKHSEFESSASSRRSFVIEDDVQSSSSSNGSEFCFNESNVYSALGVGGSAVTVLHPNWRGTKGKDTTEDYFMYDDDLVDDSASLSALMMASRRSAASHRNYLQNSVAGMREGIKTPLRSLTVSESSHNSEEEESLRSVIHLGGRKASMDLEGARMLSSEGVEGSVVALDDLTTVGRRESLNSSSGTVIHIVDGQRQIKKD